MLIFLTFKNPTGVTPMIFRSLWGLIKAVTLPKLFQNVPGPIVVSKFHRIIRLNLRQRKSTETENGLVKGFVALPRVIFFQDFICSVQYCYLFLYS